VCYCGTEADAKETEVPAYADVPQPVQDYIDGFAKICKGEKADGCQCQLGYGVSS
jgi:hypothetical protein